MSNVYLIQHAAVETPGLIAAALKGRGIGIEMIRPFKGDCIPSHLGDHAGLVVMGGPMGVYEQDQYPFLKDEIRLIQQAVRAGKPVLGVCLGSQLLAAALGAPVTRGPRKEIGWFPVTLTPVAAQLAPWRAAPPRFTALHWHGDVFALPAGAVSLAASELTAHQAFAYGPAAWGILFHLEVTEAIIAGMVANFAGELCDAGVNGRQLITQAGRLLPEFSAIGRTIFEGWASLVKGSPAPGRSYAMDGV